MKKTASHILGIRIREASCLTAITALCLLVCGSASAEYDWTFKLKQAGVAKAAGPFTFKNDAKVVLLTKEFTIVDADKEKKTFKLKMTEGGNVFGPYQMKNSGRVQIGRAAFAVSDLIIPGLKLSVSYKSGMAGSKDVLDELMGIFSQYGSAATDLDPHPDIEIYKGIKYLDQVEGAGRQFGMKRMTSGSTINPPGFPRNSFRYYQCTGSYADGCNKALLVGDLQMQVVAIQFVDENPTKTRISRAASGERVYNIVQFRQTTPSARNYVRREVSASGDNVIVKHEYYQNGKIKEYTELHIPKIVVNLLLDTMRHFRAK